MQGQHVPFPGEPLVGLLDVGLAGAPADPQHAVRVEFARRGRSQRRQQQEEQHPPGPSRLHGPAGPAGGGSGRAALSTQRCRFRRARPPSPWRPSASGKAGLPRRRARRGGLVGQLVSAQKLWQCRGLGSEWGWWQAGAPAVPGGIGPARGLSCSALRWGASPGVLRADVGTAI